MREKSTEDKAEMDNIKQRMIDLETNMAFLDDTIETLNQVIAKQDAMLLEQQRMLKKLYDRLENKQLDSDIAPFDIMADKPPHY